MITLTCLTVNFFTTTIAAITPIATATLAQIAILRFCIDREDLGPLPYGRGSEKPLRNRDRKGAEGEKKPSYPLLRGADLPACLRQVKAACETHILVKRKKTSKAPSSHLTRRSLDSF